MVGDALVAHPGIDKVTFTGSPSVGRGILQGAAGNFKRVTLELGGKSANVIFAGRQSRQRRARRGVRDLLQYRAGLFGGLARSRRTRGVRRSGRMLAVRAQSIKVGDPSERETAMGPLISAGQMKTVLRLRRHRQAPKARRS